MSLKGFESIIAGATSVYSSTNKTLSQFFGTFSRQGYNKWGLDVAPRFLTEVSTGVLDTPIPSGVNIKRIVKITAHGATAGQVISFTSGPNDGVEIGIAEVLSADYLLLAGELPNNPTAADAFSLMRYVSQVVSSVGAVTATIVNPDGTDAQFNFTQTEDGTVTDCGSLSAVNTTIATLTDDLMKISVKNNSGNILVYTVGSNPEIVVAPGGGFEEFDCIASSGDLVRVKLYSGTGEAGNFVYTNYLG